MEQRTQTKVAMTYGGFYGLAAAIIYLIGWFAHVDLQNWMLRWTGNVLLIVFIVIDVIAGLVDTSGYAADVRAKYEGFLITDSAIKINGSALGIGAYGFGFTNTGRLNILDLAGNEIFSVFTTKDNQMTRPRPLMMLKSGNGIRLYSGKDYAEIVAK